MLLATTVCPIGSEFHHFCIDEIDYAAELSEGTP